MIPLPVKILSYLALKSDQKWRARSSSVIAPRSYYLAIFVEFHKKFVVVTDPFCKLRGVGVECRPRSHNRFDFWQAHSRLDLGFSSQQPPAILHQQP